MSKLLAYCFLFCIAISISSCSEKKEEQPAAKKTSVVSPRKEAVPSTEVVPAPADTGQYRAYHLSGAKSLASLSAELGTARMLILYKINRRDLKHLKEGETIVVPNKGDSELGYSPFPLHLSKLDSVKKILFVSRKIQAFAAYENGALVKWGPTSTGKKTTPTPERLYYTNWKSLETHSTVDGAWILKWYFNLDNLEGISLHQYDLPGYPASHSCVRLLEEDAEWIYHWADQWKLSEDTKTVTQNGTPVIVFGNYGYGKTPPWKKLLGNAHATDLPDEEINSSIEKDFPH